MHRYSRRVPVILVTFQIYLSANFMKIHLVGAELFHTDGRTDRQTDGLDETINSKLELMVEMS
jgi:hypothetical protein